MMRVRSPLLIPEARGTVFRVLVSTIGIALSIAVFVFTLRGVHSGILTWPSRYQPHIRIDRLAQPEMFWSAAVIWLGMCAWLCYASVAEIFYAMRIRKQR